MQRCGECLLSCLDAVSNVLHPAPRRIVLFSSHKRTSLGFSDLRPVTSIGLVVVIAQHRHTAVVQCSRCWPPSGTAGTALSVMTACAGLLFRKTGYLGRERF